MVNIGKKIERIRTIRGIKQETLAAALGVSQGAISRMEHSDTIDEEKLASLAKALGVTPEAIKNFEEAESTANYLNLTSNVQDKASAIVNHVNPTDKMVELYERLLDNERKKVELLEAKLRELESKLVEAGL